MASWRSVVVGALLVSLAAAGPLDAGPYRAPRTADGAPDLQGIWNTASMTKLERPRDFAGPVATPAEIAAYEKKRTAQYDAIYAPVAPDAPKPLADTSVGDATSEYPGVNAGLAVIGGRARTAWIVDPADGRLPYTEAARAKVKAIAHNDGYVFDNPDARPFNERCLLGGGGAAGPPILNTDANTFLQIVQTRDNVVLVSEMIHDARIVRLTDRRHAPAALHPWMGDSIGWWEGGALVVETTNFNPREHWHSNAGSYVLISTRTRALERFTRIGPHQILYRFEVSDPAAYTQTWKGEMLLNASAGPIYEFACHEANYALPNILAGARKAERDAATKSAPP